MKRIRINNDFTFAWAIERNGVAENLQVAINRKLYLRISTGERLEVSEYTIAGNIISVEVTPELAPKVGRYNFIFQYELLDLGLSDAERLCEVDTDAFIIVPRTAEADDAEDFLVTSDMAIGFKGVKGDPFLYSDFTPEQLEALKVKGDKGDAFEYSDFTAEQLLVLKGDTGTGIQSIVLTSTIGLVKTYTITLTDGTTATFSVEDGEGIDGDSAYQVWLDLGNVGTEQDFIDSLAAGGIDLSAYLTELEAQGLYQPIGAYLTAETDPTVPAWAKEATKPTYTAAEVGAAETVHTHTDLHKHSNKAVLDATTASFTLADESKLDGLSNYTHPATHSISEVSGLQAELDSKVDDSQVLTNVPAGALFTDTVYTHPATHEATIITQDATHRFVTDTEKTTWNGKADTIHNHDDRYYTEGEVNGLIAAIKGAYDAELVTSPTTGTLTLKNATETVLDGALTTSNVFTVALPTPVSGKVNESVLIFKIGATLPTITQPSGIVWRGSTPTLAINTSWTIVYEQVNTTGTTFEIWAVATKKA